ncbi:aminodeoxychorismate synthase, component I [Dissulfurispira thermophila]|uniref:Aminodeoxychorismate synthase, component I n=2 Tax=root TaxID=1 RepID=A0A7G1H1K8_9BACT|nr:anthranilate synthase component I family protein [Dissulfurispira thermophila]BCB96674.1 aminodeoxychorismate synthase, component I [Dissulfurispira thermophila]
MKLNINKRDFLYAVKNGSIPSLYIEIPYADPHIIYESIGCRENSILLESVKGPYKIARYSFIAFDPYLVFRVKNGEVNIEAIYEGCETWRNTVSFRNPIERLKELVMAYPQRYAIELPPFQGGAIGLLSYDFVRYIENLPETAIDDLFIPDAHFFMVDRVIAFDHQQQRAWKILSPGARDTGLGYRDISHIDWHKAYEKASEELFISSQYYSTNARRISPDAQRILLNYEMSKEQYMHIVRRAKEYIAAGDIFQANLSQRIAAEIGDRDPWEIYKVLRRVNPSPFSAYADFGSYQIVSSSPERLIRVKDDVVETRPIAGTRPRGKDFRENEQMRAELLLNEKERAEHIMLIDLERNDIGRVSRYGSVVVDELMITEDYSHVIHIVSNVRGILEKGKTCFDVIKAVFPGGTITGVPKVRCMEIIDELEPVRRGPYTGSLGYIGFSCNMDMNIIIRTFVIKEGVAYVQAGAGIVADSDPEREYYETLKKAEALIKTLEII